MADVKLRSRWVLANGVRTHFTEAGGEGKAIVMLHGGGHGSSGLSGMGPLMAELSGDFVMYAPVRLVGDGQGDREGNSGDQVPLDQGRRPPSPDRQAQGRRQHHP